MKMGLKRLRKILLLLVTIMMIFPSIVFGAEDIYAEVKNSADELAKVLVNDYGVSGIQYTLISEGKIVASGTSGVFDKDNTATLDNQSLFGIGSISKLFTTTAIMVLSDQDKLDLDEPIVTYIPEFKMADERYKEITVRMLLNHSSGIMGSTFANGFLYDYPSTLTHDKLLSQLAKQKLKAAPGEFSVYCNDGFTLAEIVVEKISKMSFSEFIKKNITEPLGMYNTYTPQDDFDRNLLVRTFNNNEETPVDTINIIGTGGVYSTAEDLCRLGQIYMNNPGYLPAANFLSQDAKTITMQKEYQRGFGPDQKEGLFGYGLGWDSVDAYPYSKYDIQPLIKGGDTQLYHGSLIVLPEYDMAFAALLSGGSSFFGQVMGQSLLLETLLIENEITEIFSPQELQAPILSSMPLELTQYTGLYANNAVIKNFTVKNDGKITISSISEKGMPDETFLYTSEGVFVNEDGSKKLTFIDESNNKTYIQITQILNLSNLGQTTLTSYEYEKIESNNIDDTIQNAWDGRNGTKYYIANENPHSQAYHTLENTYFEITTDKKLPGYAKQFKIVDKDTAIQDVQIPGMAGRDLTNIEILNIDGIKYLSSADMIFINENNMVDLYAGQNAICTTQEDGYARWYTVSQNDVGKMISVGLPENGSFAVYSQEACIYFSVVNGNQPVKLPEGGKVVFVGESPGDLFTITTNFADNQGEILYEQALNLEKEKRFSEATSLYETALALLLDNNNSLSFECGEALQRITIIQGIYPYTAEEIKGQISKKYPQVAEETIYSWIENNELEYYFYDGENHYFEDAATNLIYRHLELMYANPESQETYYDLILKINKLAEEKPESTWNQYQKPVTYHGTHTISIPREMLPEIGFYRIWLPIPINNGPQTQVEVNFVTPEKWMKVPPSIDEDIGLLYMEVPLEDLTEDVFIQVKFSFTHYEQRFTVDPQNIGEYDRDSYIYKQYTSSYGNTEITSDIHKKAMEVVGKETNPYFAARKIYDYIVNNVDYSLMPHLALWPRTSQTESDYVHNCLRGDCGAQSMYFTAMCRSIGIPARTTGGFQLFSDEFGGHFWAEFYLPNYGWIPVDTSAAQIAFYAKNATLEQKQTFIDYFFGNQDSMRCVVQKDTDEMLIPKANSMVLFPMAIQFPTVEYSIPYVDIGESFLVYWTIELEN